ncbi:MAG: diguanylate cyclase, partial [Lachnospiraceae bacterium]|nr:diguanylate cyclase [Lachnospiraceae bacterium]
VDASAIIADIDFFKQYNDLYGHQEGDKDLEQVAKCIRETVSDLNADVIRYGGEEFLIVLKEKDALKAPEVARGLVNSVYALNIKHESSDIAPYVTISAGYYCDENSILKSLTGLVDLADKALYRAKNSGRNKAEG